MMKLTPTQQSIILVSMIQTILGEYKEDEITSAIANLKAVCLRFTDLQSGVKFLPFIGPKVVDHKRYQLFIKTKLIADRIWKSTVDRYAAQNVSFDANESIRALWEYNPQMLKKYAKIKERYALAYINDGVPGSDKLQSAGSVIGGYITEMLDKEMGIKRNGRLAALKNKISHAVDANPEAAKESAYKYVELIKGVA
ncbi:hypothetical protein [Sulfuricurvum sp.]|uniref:hypothetical protein n=1 Tax=Sulfuricurvum sp. TaxID=2025608 RepID=UPI0026256D2F|nr:hypothetical protein [Sulfuricurvum sp.]MDD2267665.1 hypothetical protein [Sulfuricurvum sp.]MDD2784246.1 hypothetical protein [Sulfuricurvum sp.]